MNADNLRTLIQNGKNLIDNQSKDVLKVELSGMQQFAINISQNIDSMISKVKELDVVINSIKNSWQGADADKYINELVEYREKLKKSVVVLDEWDNYFKNSFRKLGAVKDQSLMKARNLRVLFENENADLSM